MFCKYGPMCQKYKAHFTAVNTDRATKTASVLGSHSYIKQNESLPTMTCKKEEEEKKTFKNFHKRQSSMQISQLSEMAENDQGTISL